MNFESVIRAALLSALLLFGAQSGAKAQNECAWPNSICNDPWSASQSDVWIAISSTPPCSVVVRVHWRYRCNEYELMDVTQPVVFTNPVGCATQQDVQSAWYDGRITDGIKQAIADLALARWVHNNASCCPCPSQGFLVVGRVASCQKLVLTYTLPSGSVVSVNYDLSTPWSTYAMQISMANGSNPVIAMSPCPGEACCYRNRTFCLQDGVVANVQDGPWMTFGTCDPSENSTCQIRMCE